MLKRIALAAALVATFALGASAFGLAGNGGGPNKSSISLTMLSASASTTASSGPHYGDAVTFSISTTATDQPYVFLSCSQNGSIVYNAVAGFFDGYPWGQTYTLSSYIWQGGAADCTANLVAFSWNGKDRPLASTSFHVDA